MILFLFIPFSFFFFLQDAARAQRAWLMWFVALTENEARAWAVVVHPQGGYAPAGRPGR